MRQTQKNLDAANVPMPNFGGLASKFGEPEPEPEPEPIETENERIERELYECENYIKLCQSILRGYLSRLNFDKLKFKLKLSNNSVIKFQSICKGYLLRKHLKKLREERSGSAIKWLVPFQSLCRAKLSQDQVKKNNYQLYLRTPSIVSFQSQLRKNLISNDYNKKLSSIYKHDVLGTYTKLQSQLRGNLIRNQFKSYRNVLYDSKQNSNIIKIQSSCRKALSKSKYDKFLRDIKQNENQFKLIQSSIRSKLKRSSYLNKLDEINRFSNSYKKLQSQCRGYLIRTYNKNFNNKLNNFKVQNSINLVQAKSRGYILRNQINGFKDTLSLLNDNYVKIQSCIKGGLVRDRCENILAYLDDHYQSIISVQSLCRTKLNRDKHLNKLNELKSSTSSIEKLQSHSRSKLIRLNLNDLKFELNEKLNSIISMQSFGRATIIRRNLWNTFQSLENVNDDIIKCQSQSRGYLIRKNQTKWKRHLKVNQPKAVELQSIMRGYIQRKTFGEKKLHYRNNKEKIVKIQALYRGKEKREQFKELTMGNNVPLNTVKEFVHLLDDSDYDFDEEIELVDLRKQVLESIRETQNLETHVDELDVKIALVVKNALSFDELVKSTKGRTLNSNTLNRNGTVLAAAGDPFSPNKMDKESIRRLELYQQLFWRLQNQPEYLSRLFYQMSRTEVSDKNRRLIENVIMSLFGYTQSAREEYLFLKLMQRSMHEEIKSSHHLNDVVRGSFTWVKMLLLYLRGPEKKIYLKQSLGSRINEIISLENFDLETDPVILWKQIINYQELESGKPSDKPKDVSYEEAISDSDTRVTFIHHLQQLRQATENFREDIQKSLSKMPYGLRFIARELYLALRIKFKDESEESCNRTIGQLIYYRYIHPAIVTPETFDVVSKVLDPIQRKNLNEIAKMLTQIAMGEIFNEDNQYLTPLNDYIIDASSNFIPWFGEVADAIDAESYFNAGEFLEYNTTRKPSIHISPSEIYDIHSLLNQTMNKVSPEKNDPLRLILLELGGPPLPAQGELYEARKRAISLTLTNRNNQIDNPNDPNVLKKQLWLQAKRHVLAVLRIQPERTLTNSFITEVTSEHEYQWQLFVQKEASIENSRKFGNKNDQHDFTSPFLGSGYKINDIRKMSYTEVKARAIEFCLKLEKIGEISRKDNYQTILNAIAIDVRNRNRKRIQRQKELKSMENTLNILEEKKKYLLNQQEAFNSYIETSMQ